VAARWLCEPPALRCREGPHNDQVVSVTNTARQADQLRPRGYFKIGSAEPAVRVGR
jgi:hypothetical protein